MEDQRSEIIARIPWQKLLIWGLFLFSIYYLRDLFFVVFMTFLMSYIVRSIVVALLNRISPGEERPWLDRALTFATFAGVLICVSGVFTLVGPRFLRQSQLLLVQIKGIRPQDSLNSLLDRTVGVFLFRRTYGKPGDERYDAAFKQYTRQGRHGEGLYHDFPSLKLDLESGFEVQYEQTEQHRLLDEVAPEGAMSRQFDQWFLTVKAPALFAQRRDSYLARWMTKYVGPEKADELEELKKQDGFAQTRDNEIRQLILRDVKSDPSTLAELEAEWEKSVVQQHWSKVEQSPEYQSQFREYYEHRRKADPVAVPLPYKVYVELVKAYPEGKEQFLKVFREHGNQASESPPQLQADFERATRRELARKWWTTDPAAVSLREHALQAIPKATEVIAFRVEEIVRSFISLPAQFVTALLLTVFITLDFVDLKKASRRLRDSRVGGIYDEIASGSAILARLIGKSFSAQGLIAIFNTLFTFIMLWFLGIQNELLFCAVVFVASFIPVLGVVLSGIPITLQAILQPGGSIGLALQVIVGIIMIHLIEASVLSPKIVGKVLHLHPVIVLAVLAVGEHLCGIWGLLLGVPVAVYIFRVVLLHEAIPGIYEPGSDGNTT